MGLSIILARLAEGADIKDILKDFPSLKSEDVRAVSMFAAMSAEEDLPYPSIPSVVSAEN